VPFVDPRAARRRALWCCLAASWLVGLGGCSTLRKAGDSVSQVFRGSPDKGGAGSSAAGAKPDAQGRSLLPAPSTSRSMAEVRLQAAKRLVAANPDITYMGQPPDVLLAIPVITIELNGDGSIRRLEVMRYPGQARDTVDIAMQAIRRAAPFGDVSRLPKPWKFNETFLFNDQRKFKPVTLDQ